MKNKFLKYSLVTAAIVILVVICIFGFKLIKDSSSEGVNELGIVNLEVLISNHPDFAKLMALEEKINALKEQLNQSPNPLKNVGITMKKMQDRAEKNLLEELETIKAKMNEERNLLGKEITNEQEEMKKELKKLKTSKPELELTSPKKVSSKTIKQNLDQFSKDLLLLKEKQVAAKRLELQKNLSEELRALKEKNEEEVSAYERELLKQDQGQKIDLKLKYENAETVEARESVLQAIKSLEEKENNLKEVKQTQLNKKFEDIKNKKLREIEVEVASYDKMLQKDVAAQLSGKNIYEKKSGDELLSPQNSALKEKFTSQNEKYKKQIEEINIKYAKQFEEKKKELEGKLKIQEKELIAKALKKENSLDSVEEKHVKEIEEQIKMLEEQRDRLYEEILNDIRIKVEKLAKEEKIKQIIGGYLYNTDCINLTEKVLDLGK